MKIIALCLIMLSMSAHALDGASYLGTWKVVSQNTADPNPDCVATPITITKNGDAFAATIAWSATNCPDIGLKANPAAPVPAAVSKDGKTFDITVPGDDKEIPAVVISIGAIDAKVAPITLTFTNPGTDPKTIEPVTAKGTQTPPPPPADVKGKWTVAAKDPKADTSKCCFPATMKFSTLAGSETQVTASYTFPTDANNAGCKAFGVTTTTPAVSQPVTLGSTITWTDKIDPNTATWTLTQPDSTVKSLDLKESITGDIACEFTLTPVSSKINYAQTWNVKPDTGYDATKCCYPQTITVAAGSGDASSEYTVTAVFDQSKDGCTNAGVTPAMATTYSEVMDKTDKLTLNFGTKLGIDASKPFSATISQTTATPAVTVFTESLGNSCTATLVTPPPNPTYAGKWDMTAPAADSKACLPKYINFVVNKADPTQYDVELAFNSGVSTCTALGVDNTKLKAKGKVAVADPVIVDFTKFTDLSLPATTKAFSVAMTLTKNTQATPATTTYTIVETIQTDSDPADIKGLTFKQHVYPTFTTLNNFKPTLGTNNVADKCCIPTNLNIVAKQGTTDTVTVSGTFDATLAGCTALGVTPANAGEYTEDVLIDDNLSLNFAKKITGATKTFTGKLSVGQNGVFSLTETADTQTCTATYAVAPINYVNKWSVKPDTGYDATKCCYPQTITVALKDGDATQYTVTAAFDQSKDACANAGVTTAMATTYTENMAKDNKLTLNFGTKLGIDAAKPFSAIVSQTTATPAVTVLTETIGTDQTQCKATLTVVPPVLAYTGQWDVIKPTATFDPKCCYPMYVNFAASQADNSKYTFETAFPTGVKACVDLGVDGAKLKSNADVTAGDTVTVDFTKVTPALTNAPKTFTATFTKNGNDYTLTESVQLPADTAATSCIAASVIPHLPPKFNKIQNFNGVPAQGTDNTNCCIPKTLNVVETPNDATTFTVTGSFDTSIAGCGTLGVTAANAATYSQVVPKGESLALDFAAGLKITGKTFPAKLYADKDGSFKLSETVGQAQCSATFVAPVAPVASTGITWTSHWVITEDTASNDKANCCVPNHIKIIQKDANTYTVSTKVDSTQAGCQKAGITDNKKTIGSVDVAVGDPLVINLPNIQNGKITLTGNGETTFALSETINGVTCTGTGKQEPINYIASWKVPALAADTDANTAKCCAPSSLYISEVTNSAATPPTSQYQVVANFPATGNGCPALGANAKLDQNIDITSKLTDISVTQTINSVPVTLKISKDASGAYNIEEGIAGATCKAAITKIPANWEGVYKVTPVDANNKKCCYPMSNIIIKNQGKQTFIQGRWDNSDACKAIHIENTIFSFNPSTKTNAALGGLLSLSEFSLDKNKFNPSITQDANGAINFFYKYEKQGLFANDDPQIECSAALATVANAKAPLLKYVKWGNTWKFVKASDNCCLPTGDLKITYTENPTAPAKKYAFTLNALAGQCKVDDKTDLTGAQLTLNDDGPGDYATVWPFKSNTVTVKVDGADTALAYPFTLSYQLNQLILSMVDTATPPAYCRVLYNTDKFETLDGFPGVNNPKAAEKGGDKKKGVQAWVYVVVILVIVVLAIGGYYLYNRHKAAKLNQSLQDEYQKTLLKA